MAPLRLFGIVLAVSAGAVIMTAARSQAQPGGSKPAPVVKLVSEDKGDGFIVEIIDSQYRDYKSQLSTARMEELRKRQMNGLLSHPFAPTPIYQMAAQSLGSPLRAAMRQFGYFPGKLGFSTGTPPGPFGNFQGVGGSLNGNSFQDGFCGSLGALGTSQATDIITNIIDAQQTERKLGIVGSTGVGRAAELVAVITKVINPDDLFVTYQSSQYCPFESDLFGFGAIAGIGGNQFGMVGGNMFGMMGNVPPPTPEILTDVQHVKSIEYFPPALTIILRSPSRIHTSIYGGIVSGKQKRIEAAILDAQEKGLDVLIPKGKIQVGNTGGGDDPENKQKAKVVMLEPKKTPTELDPTTVWNEALSKGGVDAGMVIAIADYLFEAGKFLHAAEFLKANLRAGIVVRPWVYEALAVALEASGADPEEISRARDSAALLNDRSRAKQDPRGSLIDLWKLRGFHSISGTTEIHSWAGPSGTLQD
jgi:hypothetical protein